MSIFGAAVGLALLIALLNQADWIPFPIRSLFTPPNSGNRIFVAQADLSHDQAKELYRQALTDLNDSNYDKALDEFKQLEKVYSGLLEVLWLHEAECYAGQGNEWAVQKKLRNLIEQHGDSPLKAVALYRIGQSQFRGSEWKQAQQTFERVKAQFASTPYAMGSLYYQGAILAKADETKPQAIAPLKEYLHQCPECKFSGEAADLLEKLLPHPTPEEHALIGIADAATSKDIKNTLFHLTQGSKSLDWLALGKSQIHVGQVPLGVQTLSNGLAYAKDMDTARTGIDTILAHTPADRQVTLLKGLVDKKLPVGGDYVLWKLAEADSSQAKTYYQKLVQNYPQGDYAPESGWQLLWPLLAEGNSNGFVGSAQNYLSHYPYARSAPKALFWIGKLLEKSNPSEATRTYEHLLHQYTTSYYAFRAKGRLKVLAEGKPDPGWPTLSTRMDYPPQDTDLNTLDILPPPARFASGDRGWILHNKAKELQNIGAADDVTLVVTEALGELPPAVESWADQISGDRAKGLRVIRDALEKQAKDAFLASGGKLIDPPENTNDLKLLYPVYFPETITQAGHSNRLDPFLIQALMREESYFNEFAISGSNARGLMQLMPATAKDVAGWENIPNFKTSDLFLPAINIQLGSRYLAHLHELFNGNSMPAVGAYNGGPGAMKRWVQSSTKLASDPDMFVEQIPYEQSRDYIKKVFASYWNYTRLYSHSPI
jgi:soluble lytic murein transglycosylase